MVKEVFVQNDLIYMYVNIVYLALDILYIVNYNNSMFTNLPDLCPESCRISKRQSVAVPRTFSYMLHHDISIGSVSQWNDNSYYGYAQNSTTSLSLSRRKVD